MTDAKKKPFFSRLLATALVGSGLSGTASAEPASENMELLGAIAREIVACGELDDVDWIEVSAVFAMDDEGDVNESYGYAYDGNGRAHAAAFLYDRVEREVKRYRDWLGEPAGKGFIKMLFQFNRRTHKVNATFEYSDLTRWQVTPDNVDRITAELRPRWNE